MSSLNLAILSTLKQFRFLLALFPEVCSKSTFGKDQRKGREHPEGARMLHSAMGKQEEAHFLTAWNPEK